MQPRVILDSKKFSITLDRLCIQLIENHRDFKDTVLIGIQPRGVWLSDRIHKHLKKLQPNVNVPYGKLDITLYRDDIGRREKVLAPSPTTINFQVEHKNVVLVDDVLYTGRTIRSALDGLLDFGRPQNVELLVLIDRRLHRHLPIQPDYIGKTIDSIESEQVKVEWKEKDGADKVWILEKDKPKP